MGSGHGHGVDLLHILKGCGEDAGGQAEGGKEMNHLGDDARTIATVIVNAVDVGSGEGCSGAGGKQRLLWSGDGRGSDGETSIGEQANGLEPLRGDGQLGIKRRAEAITQARGLAEHGFASGAITWAWSMAREPMIERISVRRSTSGRFSRATRVGLVVTPASGNRSAQRAIARTSAVSSR